MKTPGLFFILFMASFLSTAQGETASPPAAAPQAGAYSENACVACHQNLVGRLSEIVQQWRSSVHFTQSVACDGCHGGDATVKREFFDNEKAFKNRSHLKRSSAYFNRQGGSDNFTPSVRGREISYFCGKCHGNIKEKHLGSPHGGLGSPSCIYCHGAGSHAITEPSLDIIDPRSRSEGGRCAACHKAGTMAAVATVKRTLSKAEEQLQTATEQYHWLEKHHYYNLELERMFDHSQETLSQLRQTFHSFNMQKINNFASTIHDNADLVEQTYEMIVSLEEAKKQQAGIGVLSVAFLLGFAALLLYYRKAFLHD